MQRSAASLFFVCVIGWIGSVTGCTATPPPVSTVRVDAGRYEEAFAAAVDAVRVDHMPAMLRDRRGGLIETAPTYAPSLIEPWIEDGASLLHRWRSTTAHHRRRAELVFAPPTDTLAVPDPVPAAPDLLGVADTADLTAWPGPLVLHVRVYLERAQNSGLRRSTWTRRRTSRATEPAADGGPDLPSTWWTPVARDHDFEARLARRIEATLGERDDLDETKAGG